MLKIKTNTNSKNVLISNHNDDADVIFEKNERSTDTLMPIRAENDTDKIDKDIDKEIIQKEKKINELEKEIIDIKIEKDNLDNIKE